MYYASDGSANTGGTINITDAPTKKSRVRTIASSAGSNSGGDTYTNYTVDVVNNVFTLDGNAQPILNVYKDSFYRFDQSDPDNVGQRLFVSNDLSGRAVNGGSNALILTENTAGVTSTGTLGTDLVTTWKVPSNASDTMYYASEGDANAGGKINVEVKPYEEKTFTVDVSMAYKKVDISLAGGGGLDGYSSNQGVATASSIYPGDVYKPWHAFYGNVNEPWKWASTFGVPQWLQFEFPYDVTITKYKIWGVPNDPEHPRQLKSWELRAVTSSQTYNASDSNTYSVLHSESGLTSWPEPNTNSLINDTERLEYTIPVEKQQKARKIILYITEMLSTLIYLGEVVYYGYHDSSPVEADGIRLAIDSELQPTLNLYRDSVYKFDQSDASNVGQRLFVSNDLTGRSIVNIDSIIYEIPSNLTTTNYFNGSTNAVLGSDVTFDWSKDWEIKTSFTINQYTSYPRIFSFVININHGSSGSHSEFEILFDDTGKQIGLMIQDPQPFPENSALWISGQNNNTLGNQNLPLNTRYNVLVKYVYSTGVITAGFQLHSNFTSWDDVIIQGTKFVDSSQTGNGGYGSAVTFTGSITYQTQYSRIGDRSTNDRKFNGTIHSLTMTNGTSSSTILSENTRGVTSTGTLGTDLITRWRIPTDASDTMYYASDGSANIGGTINILYSTPTIVCLTSSSAVNVISSGGNKYRFNGDSTYVANKYYGLGSGTYTFTGIPSEHPIAILNAGKTSHISYTGDNANKSSKTVSGTTSDGTYDFYHGDVTVTVSGDFGSVSVYCYYHGYMGGENLLRYSNSCVLSATGGIETQHSGYRIHTFTSSGTFEVYNNKVVDYLIIGGGGGGSDGDDNTGAGPGGGAGGFVELTNISITPASYTVIVGAGGSGSILNQESQGQAGSASSFNGTTALGGGAAGHYGDSGGNGGSGGGEFRSFGVGLVTLYRVMMVDGLSAAMAMAVVVVVVVLVPWVATERVGRASVVMVVMVKYRV